MDLKQGIRIFVDKGLTNRIELSQGTIEVKEINGWPCKNRCFLPKEPWRTPDNKENKLLLFPEKERSRFNDVALVKLPKKLRQRFEALNLGAHGTREALERITQTLEYKNLVKDTIHYFERSSPLQGTAIPHNIFLGDGNLTTTTFNKRDEFFIGLHLDSFEARETPNKPEARNRFCINLGKEARYLMFVNISFDKIAELFGSQPVLGGQNPYPVMHAFFDKFPEYPVTRVRIQPMEVYIAPTENIIHDGSTIGTSSPDVNLAVRGHFRLPKRFFLNLFV
jgi:hypothetical protein